MFPFAESLSFTFTGIPADILWGVFGLFAFLAILWSIILLYHWNKYRLHNPATNKAQIIYILGTTLLLLSALGTLYLYTSV